MAPLLAATAFCCSNDWQASGPTRRGGGFLDPLARRRDRPRPAVAGAGNFAKKKWPTGGGAGAIGRATPAPPTDKKFRFEIGERESQREICRPIASTGYLRRILSLSSGVDFADLLDHFAVDRGTRAILLYIESIKDARKFMSAARAAARAKPVLVVKSGRHAAGAKAAMTHKRRF